MYTKIYSISHTNFQEKLVKIEASMSKGMFAFSVIGCVKSYSKEIYTKTNYILKSLGLRLPSRKILINISDVITNDYEQFDLPIILAVLDLIGYIKLDPKILLCGQVMLNGDLVKLRNPYKTIKSAIKLNVKNIIIPKNKNVYNIFYGEINVLLAENISEIIYYFKKISKLKSPITLANNIDTINVKPDINDIVGQEKLIRALILAILGRHHILIEGASGAGKTYAIKAIESIIPRALSDDLLILNAYEKDNKAFVDRPIFNYVYPHLSLKQMVGSERNDSCLLNSDRGFLVMNEISLFSNSVLNNLRIAMEENKIKINIKNEDIDLKSYFTLISSNNPCSCGNLYSQVNKCSCSQRQIDSYRRKLSLPLRERFQIVVRVDNELEIETNNKNKYDIEDIKNKILRAWNIQRKRYVNCDIFYNGLVDELTLKSNILVKDNVKKLIKELKLHYKLSERKLVHMIRIARSIADYENDQDIGEKHIFEAVNYLI